MTPLIEIEALYKSRRDSERLFRLTIPAFSLARSGKVALVGPSGCGKSTFIDVLALALRPDAFKKFRLHDVTTNNDLDLGHLWRDEEGITNTRARHFGYVQQTGGLLGFLNVRDNISLGLKLAGLEEEDRIEWLSDRLGIADVLQAKPAALSLGQRQRVTIARALVHNPSLVLADEPTASLDLENAEGVLTLLCEISSDLGIALVLATHNPPLAEKFGFHLCPAIVDQDGDGQITRFERARV